MAHTGLFPLDLQTPRAAVVRARVWESCGPGRACACASSRRCWLQPFEKEVNTGWLYGGCAGPHISCVSLGK